MTRYYVEVHVELDVDPNHEIVVEANSEAEARAKVEEGIEDEESEICTQLEAMAGSRALHQGQLTDARVLKVRK